ncbi:hypothetical protein GQ44DRAFT_779613 [Phaeosphaeriaceae sp. PMI808]|nr:hypothetical protein GQ44DRAFT_779613 [Phaeosphaeriaceae sp. PMI808]
MLASTGYNPLHEFFTPSELVIYALDFFTKLGRAVEIQVFVKGSLYFQEHDDRNLDQLVSELRLDPGGFPELDLEFKEPEVESIEIFETQGRRTKFFILWHTSAYRLLLIACWLAAITQGMCQSVMNGANLFWPAALGLDISDIANNPLATNNLKFGLINGAPFLVGAVSGFFFTDPISNERHFGQGRRSVLILASIVTIAASIGSALVQTPNELLYCRLVLGIGMGSKATIVSTSPPLSDTSLHLHPNRRLLFNIPACFSWTWP